MNEILDTCDYCLRKGRKRNLARVTWLVNDEQNKYCPHCLQGVLDSMMETPWTREHGYRVDYPWRISND